MCALIFAAPCCNLAVIFALPPYRGLTVILSAYIFGLPGNHPDSVATRVETMRLETYLSVRTAVRTSLCVPASTG